MWHNTIRCLACGLERVVYPETIDIGPVRDQVVITGSDAKLAGLTIHRTELLYKGGVLPLRCPFCDLVIHIATDLAPDSLRRYLGYQTGSIAGLEMERAFNIRAGSCTLKSFPMDCARCGKSIGGPNAERRCVDCGSVQVQLVRSGPVEKS
jgi:hypothetical protein